MQTVVRNSGHGGVKRLQGDATTGKGPHVLILSTEKERGMGGQGAVAGRGAAGWPGPRGADVRWTHRRPRRLRQGDRAQWPLQAG